MEQFIAIVLGFVGVIGIIIDVLASIVFIYLVNSNWSVNEVGFFFQYFLIPFIVFIFLIIISRNIMNGIKSRSYPTGEDISKDKENKD